jgi:hypothetical protein
MSAKPGRPLVKIVAKDVAADNLPELRRFVPAGLVDAARDAQAESLVVVPPPVVTDQTVYKVTFTVPFLVLVADPEPFVRTLTAILRHILGSANMAPITLINQIGELESDIEKIASHLKTKADTGILSLTVPIQTEKGCQYTVTSHLIGKIAIDNNSEEDAVAVKTYVQWNGEPAPPKDPTRIPGESFTDIPGNLHARLEKAGLGTGYDYVRFYFSATASTDGGFINTEFSSIYVRQVEITITETCPKTVPSTPPGAPPHGGTDGSPEVAPPKTNITPAPTEVVDAEKRRAVASHGEG